MAGISALVVMGVTACGKSTVAQAIARRIGGRHIEGDLFHSAENIRKMREGIALTDADRTLWLHLLGELLADAVTKNEKPVLSCSALRRSYRDHLRAAVPALGFVFLEIDEAEVRRRAARRRGHFMSSKLIDSQFATLESPVGEPCVLRVDATLPVERIGQLAQEWWLARR